MANSPNTSTELHAIAHELLKFASRAYALGRQLQLVTLLVTLAVVFFPLISYFAAIAAFLFQCAAFYVRHQGQRQQGIGDEIRRGALLLDALGQSEHTFDLTELVRKAGVKARNRAAANVTPDYFASKASSGLVRLRDHLRENSFWNRCLYQECAQTGTRILALVGTSAALLFLLAIAIVPPRATTNLTRVFVALMGFLVAYALVTDILSWKSASRAIESLDRRLDSLKRLSEKDLRDKALGVLLSIFAEYTVATSKVPPIPHRVYTKHREGLNISWDERESGLSKTLLGVQPAGTATQP